MNRLPLKFFRGACRDRAAGKRRIIKVLFRVSLRCRAGAQDLVKMRHEGDRRDRSCQNIADRLSRQYGEYFVLKELRKDKDQRDQEDQLTQAGQEQADLCLAERQKALLAGKLKTKGEDTNHINAQRPYRICGQIRIAGKEPGENLRRQQQDNPADGRERNTDAELREEGFLYPVVIPGTEVVTDDRLSALADALQRHGDELTDARDDRHGADCQISAVAGQAGGETD